MLALGLAPACTAHGRPGTGSGQQAPVPADRVIPSLASLDDALAQTPATASPRPGPGPPPGTRILPGARSGNAGR
jgi:hypothetical protein